MRGVSQVDEHPNGGQRSKGKHHHSRTHTQSTPTFLIHPPFFPVLLLYPRHGVRTKPQAAVGIAKAAALGKRSANDMREAATRQKREAEVVRMLL